MELNNISPDIWGPFGWKFMHYITFTYPTYPTEEEKDNYKTFFLSMSKVLPCLKCRMNFKNHLVKYPLDDETLKTKKNLIEWLVNIHNEVNIMNNKPIMTPNEVMIMYLSNPKSILDKLYSTILKNVLFIVVIIIIIYFIINYYQLSNKNFNVNLL